MKILFLIDCLHSGGKERRLVELLTGLKNYPQISPKLIVMSDDVHYKEVFKLGIPIYFIIRKTRKDTGVFFRLFKLVKRINPDIIQSHSSMTSVYIFPIAKLLRIPFINAMISTATKQKLFSKVWFRSKLTFAFSAIIVSNSYAGLVAFKSPKNKSFVIYNGFDFKRLKNLISAKKIKEEFNIKTEYIIGMVAGFNDHKDYMSYINAANIILKQRKDITFLCVGDGPELEKIKKIAEGNEKIIFTGRRSDIESIVSIFDIGVLMTNYRIHEGISNSIMEYMALGKPVIATDCGGTKELVVNNETGFLIKPMAVSDLVEKIYYILDSREKIEEIGKLGEYRIKDKFSLKKMINSYLYLYRRLTCY